MKQNIYLLVILMIVFSSCETEDPLPTYTLSTNVTPSDGGKITVSPQSPNYNEGEEVTLSPEPNEGWIFESWGGDLTISSTPLQITMNSNLSVVAIFQKRNYPLNITIEGEGTVEERIVTSPTGREYPHGTTVELTPKPKEGWVFDGWEGDLNGTESPKTITVDKEKNVTIKFKRREYPLNITIVGEGTVEERIVTNSSGREYPHGTTVELTPKPKEGWVFDSWGGDLSGKENPKSVTVDKEKNVIIKFIPINFKLAENGVTCLCNNAIVGEKGFINGIEYEAVDNTLLRKRRNERADMTKLCTSLVTDMAGLFTRSDFNQPIGNWDVSKVINMNSMFSDSQFNQNIGEWDVSNVTDMSGMFASCGDRPVCLRTPFNQPIGDWDVGKVKDMSGMFFDSNFNQPIGNWNVSNVTDMGRMFGAYAYEDEDKTPFDQSIGRWDVRSVRNMNGMFVFSEFNQPITKWCVTNIKSEPEGFSTYSPLVTVNKPKWGTCPG